MNDQLPQPGFRHHSIPLEILDDLGSRFIINVPDDQRKDLIRMCFQIEVAHWFYIDEYVSNEERANSYKPRLRQCWLREFAEHMFRHVGFLRCHADNVGQILDDFKAYKLAVPTYGGIILNEDMSKVLLVLGFWSKTSWGFPKGKVNEDEPPHLCAVREVLEETGYDISDKIDPDEFIAKEIAGQRCCLYMIRGVPEETAFAPKTKKEIKDIKWFPIAGIPMSRKDEMPPQGPLNPHGVSSGNLFMVIPFVSGIKRWIAAKVSGRPTGGRISRQNSHNPRQSNKSRNEREPEKEAVAFTDDFIPKAWINFRIRKRDLLNAIESTPGWIK